MSEKEKSSILEALTDLPEKDKAFVLGYAAGRSASTGEDLTEKQEGVVTNGCNANNQTGADSTGSQ